MLCRWQGKSRKARIYVNAPDTTTLLHNPLRELIMRQLGMVTIPVLVPFLGDKTPKIQ
jgi:hypothetical protein